VVCNPEAKVKTLIKEKTLHGDAILELIESISPKGSIAKFLKGRGGGIHHLSLGVDSIEQELKSLQAKDLANCKDSVIYQIAGRALSGETEVPGVSQLFPTGLNFVPPPPVRVASAVIGQVASRLFNYNS